VSVAIPNPPVAVLTCACTTSRQDLASHLLRPDTRASKKSLVFHDMLGSRAQNAEIHGSGL
jgi:hypothetical protein